MFPRFFSWGFSTERRRIRAVQLLPPFFSPLSLYCSLSPSRANIATGFLPLFPPFRSFSFSPFSPLCRSLLDVVDHSVADPGILPFFLSPLLLLFSPFLCPFSSFGALFWYIRPHRGVHHGSTGIRDHLFFSFFLFPRYLPSFLFLLSTKSLSRIGGRRRCLSFFPLLLFYRDQGSFVAVPLSPLQPFPLIFSVQFNVGGTQAVSTLRLFFFFSPFLFMVFPPAAILLLRSQG